MGFRPASKERPYAVICLAAGNPKPFTISFTTAAAARAAVATIMGQANNCGGRILKAEYRGRVFVANSTTKKERR